MRAAGRHLGEPGSWRRADRVACAVAAVALLACAAVATRAGEADAWLRVMSFNIRVDLVSDGPNAWPLRKDQAASMIRFHRADLVGLQEALGGQVGDLEASLPGFAAFGVGRAADGGGERSAILYRKDRLELLEQGTFWLSETPLVAGSRGWDAALPRIVTWGRLRDLRSGVVFYHFNTHLDHVGEVARRESALLIRARIQATAGSAPVILTGDLNSRADGEPWRILAGGQDSANGESLVDAMTVSRQLHHGPTSTWNGFQAIEPGRRIDFIFVSHRTEVIAHGILADTFDGRFPSDHLPVLAEVALR